MDYYSARKKNEILPLVKTRMDLEGIMLSKISQTDKDKYCTILLICGIKKTPKPIDTENRLAVARGGGLGVGEMG